MTYDEWKSTEPEPEPRECMTCGRSCGNDMYCSAACEPSEPMTFAQVFGALGRMLKPLGGSFALTVQLWHYAETSAKGVEWKLWVAAKQQHVEAHTPERLIEKVRELLASKADDTPRGPESVVI